MTHIMLDIETLGTKPGCIVMSIGACRFEPHGVGHDKEFYQNIDPHDSRDAWCLRSDPSTVQWWKEQSEEAKAHLIPDRISTLKAVEKFTEWFHLVRGEQVWCQGATFDAPITEELFKITGQRIPWKFWNIRDTRTVYDVFSFDPKSIEREGTYHNALDDAIHQVKCVQEALRSLS